MQSKQGRLGRSPLQKGLTMKRKEIILFAIIIILANIPLLFGRFSNQLIYLPEKVLAGQWWRLVTHPFVHISLYHLLLDGAAFLMLYAQLAQKSIVKRIGYLLGIHSAVVAAVTVSLPSLRAVGYCGLSGIAHGLMALWCLERIGSNNTDRTERWLAAVIGIGLLAKTIYEAAVGHVLFESMHLGSVGVPVVISHLAGVIGAWIVYVIFNLKIQTFIRPRAVTNRIFQNT